MKTFTIGGMKFYGNPEQPSSIYAYEADGSADAWIPSSYILLDEAGYNAIRAIQAEEQASNTVEMAIMARSKRDGLLRDVYDVGISMCQRLLRGATDPQTSETITNKISELDAYASGLQDIPNQVGFPREITWPQQPSKDLP